MSLDVFQTVMAHRCRHPGRLPQLSPCYFVFSPYAPHPPPSRLPLGPQASRSGNQSWGIRPNKTLHPSRSAITLCSPGFGTFADRHYIQLSMGRNVHRSVVYVMQSSRQARLAEGVPSDNLPRICHSNVEGQLGQHPIPSERKQPPPPARGKKKKRKHVPLTKQSPSRPHPSPASPCTPAHTRPLSKDSPSSSISPADTPTAPRGGKPHTP